jgi:hypothetical protein
LHGTSTQRIVFQNFPKEKPKTKSPNQIMPKAHLKGRTGLLPFGEYRPAIAHDGGRQVHCYFPERSTICRRIAWAHTLLPSVAIVGVWFSQIGNCRMAFSQRPAYKSSDDR